VTKQDKKTEMRGARHLSRDEVLRFLAEHGQELREELAHRPDADPDVLEFIAREGSAAAVRAVAANPGASAATNRYLAESRDGEVRAELARKIGRLLPGLPRSAAEDVRRLTLETLQCLADDQLPRVRQILAEEIKDLDCVPKDVALKLARDIECVSAPVLEYSPLLSDADLIEIITSAGAKHALSAVARRKPLSASVSEAIASAMDVPAVAALLKNANAQIRQKTMDKIVEQAERIREWHGPLVMRSDLSQRAIRRIACFVSASLIDQLASRRGLDGETRAWLRQRTEARLDEDGVLGSAAAVVAARHRQGTLDDRYVASAAQDGQRDIVVHSLARLAVVPKDVVHRILDSRLAKPVTALVWRAGLSMRVAFKIQSFLLHLPAAELLPAREGVHFPLEEDEMRWHLSYFGLDD
jgi:uncharacterized protein (DUF2336 family)